MSEVNWGDNVPISQVHLFSGKTGVSYRIALIEKGPIMARVHYDKISKQYLRCRKDGFPNEICPDCLSAADSQAKGWPAPLGDPAPRFATNVIVYDTEADGTLKTPLKAQVMVWRFGWDKFALIREVKKVAPDLQKQDLLLTCMDEQFQKFTIMPCPNAVWLTNQEVCNAIVAIYNAGKRDLNMVHPVYLDLETYLNKKKFGPKGARQQPAMAAVQPVQQLSPAVSFDVPPAQAQQPSVSPAPVAPQVQALAPQAAVSPTVMTDQEPAAAPAIAQQPPQPAVPAGSARPAPMALEHINLDKLLNQG